MTADKIKNWYKYYNILLFDTIDSTNDEAKRIINSGATGEFIILSKSQTNGRGRLGRNWYSPNNNFYLSLILRPDFELSILSQFSFVVAVSLGQTINSFLKNNKIQYKWPNDVLIDGKKIAGILIESSITNNDIQWLIVGIGVNLNNSPNINDYPTTSIFQETNNNYTSDFFLNSFIQNFQKSFLIWKKEGFNIIKKEWLFSANNLKQIITTSTLNSRISGRFETIDNQGNLILKLANNNRLKISSGEIFFNKK